MKTLNKQTMNAVSGAGWVENVWRGFTNVWIDVHKSCIEAQLKLFDNEEKQPVKWGQGQSPSDQHQSKPRQPQS